MDNWKKKTLLVGGLIGLVAGLAASFIIIQRSEKENTLPALTATDGVRFGLGFLTFLKLITDIVVKE